MVLLVERTLGGGALPDWLRKYFDPTPQDNGDGDEPDVKVDWWTGMMYVDGDKLIGSRSFQKQLEDLRELEASIFQATGRSGEQAETEA